MSEVVKVCKKHGDLTADQIVEHKSKLNKNGLQVRCKLCCQENNWQAERKRVTTGKHKKYTKVSYICKIHGERRDSYHVGYGKCRACIRSEARKNLAENYPDKLREFNKKDYQSRKKSLGEEGMIKRATKERARVYKMTVEQYEKMVTDQDNKCKICNRAETRMSSVPGKICRLVVDHCHDTDQVRALLCHKCNLMLGASTDSSEILAKGVEYLKGFDK